jgi:cell wall-associated NlpC family hydrolase
MKNLITKVFSVGVFSVALCIGLQTNALKVKADAQIGSQQGVVLKSTSLTTDKVIVAPKKETETVSSSSAKSTSSNGSVSLSRGSSSQSSSRSSAIVSKAFQYLGRPYVWGASGPRAFDCSGFTSYVYSAFGVSLPHKASSQAGIGQTVSKSNLQAGDLIFFNTTGGISHVGMYIGSGQFIHASSGSSKVTVSELSSSYYASRFVTAKRVLK